MNRTVDLMPASCRAILNRRILVRRWSVTGVMTGALILSIAWSLGIGNHVLRRRREAMSSAVQENWKTNEAVGRLLREIDEVETAVTRYNRLAWPVRASNAIDAIASSMAESITLTELSITPREEKASRSSESKGGEAEAPRVLMIVEIEGFAVTDGRVAEFVSGLDADALFSRVTLDFTRAKGVRGADARNFRVTCEIDLSARYVFVSGEEAD